MDSPTRLAPQPRKSRYLSLSLARLRLRVARTRRSFEAPRWLLVSVLVSGLLGVSGFVGCHGDLVRDDDGLVAPRAVVAAVGFAELDAVGSGGSGPVHPPPRVELEGNRLTVRLNGERAQIRVHAAEVSPSEAVLVLGGGALVRPSLAMEMTSFTAGVGVRSSEITLFLGSPGEEPLRAVVVEVLQGSAHHRHATILSNSGARLEATQDAGTVVACFTDGEGAPQEGASLELLDAQAKRLATGVAGIDGCATLQPTSWGVEPAYLSGGVGARRAVVALSEALGR